MSNGTLPDYEYLKGPLSEITASIERLNAEQKRKPEKASNSGPPPETVDIVPAASVQPEAVSWLWPGWLAEGKLHILAGPPGVGKTTVALAIAAAITSGRPLPDGTRPEQRCVLMWSGEDDLADTLVPRLLANGGDLERFHLITGINDGQRPFDPAEHMSLLEQAMAARPEPPALLVLDSIVSAVAGDSHKNAEVRRGLQPVADLARDTGCAILGITHFSKGTRGNDPVERVTGSIAFGALARVVWAAAKERESSTAEEPARVLMRAKSNLGDDAGGFRYALEQVPIEAGSLITASRVVWKGVVPGTARDVLAEAETYTDPEERSAVEEAADWLLDRLPEGGMSRAEIMKHARADNIPSRTLGRARDHAGVTVERRGFGAGSWWLPPSVPSVPAVHRTRNVGTNGGFGTNGKTPADLHISGDGKGPSSHLCHGSVFGTNDTAADGMEDFG